jgi:3-methyladenine DNA glycosylase/8-oxoguanine DNA glycosylase
MTRWQLKSIPPHDFFLCLDADDYFDFEHQIENIADHGFTRPIKVRDKDIIVTIHFNGDPEQPIFDIRTSADLDKAEIEVANQSLKRILGTEIDLKPLMEQAQDDPVLAPLLLDFYGFKRLTRATLFEDAINRIIQTQISHKPTAKKMVYGVRSGYGTMIPHEEGLLASWPTPQQLMSGDPQNMKKYGLSLRKGEYVVGLANEIVSGSLDMHQMEVCPPQHYYDRITQVRGIGPTSAQDLLIFRSRTDAVFPSNKDKGIEKGLRRWIAYSYGANPDELSDVDFLHLISRWKGYEALAIEFLYINYLVNEKKKQKR